jgi:hypothetical protein
VTIKTELTDAWVAREQIDRDAVTGPLLLVSGEIGPTFALHPFLAREPKTDATVLVRYAMRSTSSASAVLQARLSLRIAQRSIARQIVGLLDEWTRNQARFDVPTGEPLALTVTQEDDLVVGGFTIRFPASDPWALGIG